MDGRFLRCTLRSRKPDSPLAQRARTSAVSIRSSLACAKERPDGHVRTDPIFVHPSTIDSFNDSTLTKRGDTVKQQITRRRLLTHLPACGFSAALANSALGQPVTGLSKVAPQPLQLQSKLDIASSSTQLVDVFHWARSQAM